MITPVLRLEVWFSGHVQGVGFRYTTLQIAKGFEVTGCVKNLADGRVHLIAEGAKAEAYAFRDEIARQFETFINTVESCESETAQRHTGFSIVN